MRGQPSKEWRAARIEAFEEAARHLRLRWTDDPMEIKAGNELADKLDREADRLRKVQNHVPLIARNEVQLSRLLRS